MRIYYMNRNGFDPHQWRVDLTEDEAQQIADFLPAFDTEEPDALERLRHELDENIEAMQKPEMDMAIKDWDLL